MKTYACILSMTLLFLEVSIAQVPEEIQRYRNDSRGSYQEQRKGILDGNRVRTIYFNTTEIAHWPDGLGGEWPKGTGRNYLDGATLLIGAKVHLPGGTVITPIEAHYREEFDYDPVLGQQYPWDLEPLPSYGGASSYTPAVSDNPSSWPQTWPSALGLPAEYDGQWYGYFGPGVQKNLTESFYVVDDSKDREFTRAPYNFFPIAGDTNRGGLGLRVEARSLQWNHPLTEDMVFFQYRITNISDQDYDTTSFGFYIDPGVGSYQQSTPANSMMPDTALDMCYWWSEGGIGYPDNWQTQYFAFGLLSSPENKGLTAASNNILGDKGPTGVWPKNDDVMWGKLTGGIETNPASNNGNIATVLGTGTFSLPKWKTDTLSTVLLFGSGHTNLAVKMAIARMIAKNKFIIPDTVEKLNAFDIHFNSPAKNAVASGQANISWTVSGNVGKTTAYICYSRPDSTLKEVGSVEQTAAAGQFSWNTNSVSDGTLFTLTIVCVAENGAAIAESGTFTVNNPGNAPPDIAASVATVTIGGANGYLRGFAPISWIAGDADGDPTFVNLYYQVGGTGGSQWIPIASGIPASSGSYNWDTRAINNGIVYLRAVAVAGADSTATFLRWSSSPTNGSIFSVLNERQIIPGDRLVTDRKSHGTGRFEVHVLDSSAVTGDKYVVQFVNLSPSNSIGYNVINGRTGEIKVSGCRVGGPGSESPLFDGLRLAILSDSTAIIDTATHWTTGSPDIILGVKRDALTASRDFTSPSDYQIDWSGGFVDTTIIAAPPRFPKIPLNFSITNLTQQTRVFSIVDDADRNGTLSFGDTVRFVENYVSPTNYKLTWQFAYDHGVASNPPPPSDGDRFVIKTSKPYLSGDSIFFATDAIASVNGPIIEKPISSRLLQNYPNPFNPTTDIRYQLMATSQVRLAVYDIVGREVAVLVSGRLTAGQYSVRFDARGLASGVYFYRLMAGSFVDTKKLLLLR